MNEYLKERKKKLVKAIHCSAKWKAYYKDDRAAYEAMLMESYGEKSSKDMSVPQLSDLLRFLNGIQKSPARMTPRTAPPPRKEEGKVQAIRTPAQHRKIFVLSGLIKWQYEDGLQRWCKKVFGFENPKTDAQCFKVIEGLKKMFEKQMEKEFGRDWWDMEYKDFNIRRYIEIHRPKQEAA